MFYLKKYLLRKCKILRTLKAYNEYDKKREYFKIINMFL